jgi:hypothetical protein
MVEYNWNTTFGDSPAHLLRTRHFRKAGYEVRTMLVKCFPDTSPSVLRAAFTPGGDYIGDPSTAHTLCVHYGIVPEPRTPQSKMCSVGYSKRRRKWYGWSHRAIAGFKTRAQAARYAESVS